MTAACAGEVFLREQKVFTSSDTNSMSYEEQQDVLEALAIDNDSSSSNERGETLPISEKYSRQLEIYLESRGIRTWDEHEYLSIGESASSSSLESHEFISEENSSGYNSLGVDGSTKNKVDSDLLSASSRSNSGELDCVAPPRGSDISNSFDSTLLKDSLNEIENSMNEEISLNVFESPSSKSKASVQNIKNEIHPDDIAKFYKAVRMGDAEKIEELIAFGFVNNLNEPDWNVSGDPPLLVAATNHCLPVLSVLLSSGCDPGVRSPRGETALHRIILSGGFNNIKPFIQKLLEYGCSPNVKEAGGGLTALHILTRQLSHMHFSKSTQNNLDEALESLALLANAGAINDKDHQGRSALHILASSIAFDNNHKTEIESVVKIFLDAGADTTLKNDRGETPLHESLECGALNTANCLIRYTPTGITSRYGETPLHIAARKNYIDIIGKLLENGENPSVRNMEGNTCLHLASARGFHQIVSQLVTSPLVQLEKVNHQGLTALQVAAESGFVNAVKVLLKAGADPILVANCTTLRRHPDIPELINHELTKRRELIT
ncbi:ankyrin-3-like [Chelonus insularis]|uniref:ankyrin-3-like n=1 Tax=Chelonus insularis TaxID=460826 RepID=UPI00158E5672|nr:ankyrin-3-like [Chelonus insularis]